MKVTQTIKHLAANGLTHDNPMTHDEALQALHILGDEWALRMIAGGSDCDYYILPNESILVWDDEVR